MQAQKTLTQIDGITADELLKEFSHIVEAKLQEAKERPTETKKETELLTRKETADLLKITLPTLWAWTNKNVIPAYRIGNKVRYKKSEVLKALQEINHKKANK